MYVYTAKVAACHATGAGLAKQKTTPTQIQYTTHTKQGTRRVIHNNNHDNTTNNSSNNDNDTTTTTTNNNIDNKTNNKSNANETGAGLASSYRVLLLNKPSI